MDAYLWPEVSCRLITTMIWQRRKDMGEIRKQSKECLDYVQMFVCVCVCGLYLRIIVCGCVRDFLYVCHEDTYTTWQICGCLLDIKVTMCCESHSRQEFDRIIFFCILVSVCGDEFNQETNYHHHCITKENKFLIRKFNRRKSMADQNVCVSRSWDMLYYNILWIIIYLFLFLFYIILCICVCECVCVVVISKEQNIIIIASRRKYTFDL